MAANNEAESEEPGELERQQVRFYVEPGTKVQITVDVGAEIVEGKVPLTLSIEQATEQIAKPGSSLIEISQPVLKRLQAPSVPVGQARTAFDAILSRLKTYDLATWLFIFAIA